MPSLKLVTAIIALLILTLFGFQNTQTVTFHFLSFELGPAPVVLAVVSGVLIGAVLAWSSSTPAYLRGRRKRRTLELRIAEEQRRTETAVANLQDLKQASRPPRREVPDSASPR